MCKTGSVTEFGNSGISDCLHYSYYYVVTEFGNHGTRDFQQVAF